MCPPCFQEGVFDDDEDDEGGQEEVLDEEEDVVDALWPLPAWVGGVGEGGEDGHFCE